MLDTPAGQARPGIDETNESGSTDPPRPPAPHGFVDRLRPLLAELGLDGRRLMVGGVAVVALVVGIALLRPRAATAPPPEFSLPRASTTVGGAPATTTPADDVIVHVTGEVAHPGVYRLPASARVDDAVLAAGGLTEAADQARVNLAGPLVDGERVFVPAVGQEVPEIAVGAPSVGAPASPGAATPAAVVNVNTATLAELETLPGVGPATAQAIIDHREQHGPFTSIDQLLDVRGIGDAKLAELRDRVSV